MVYELNKNSTGAAVAHCVGDKLLRHSEQGKLYVRIKVCSQVGHLKRDVSITVPVLDQLLKRGLQTETVQHFGHHVVRYVFHLIDGQLYVLLKYCETLCDIMRSGIFQSRTQMLHIELDGSEQLAQTIVSLTGSRSDIIFKPLPKDDPLQRRPDISLAEKHLAWHPDISLNDGLIKTIAYFTRIKDLLPAEPRVSPMENTR